MIKRFGGKEYEVFEATPDSFDNLPDIADVFNDKRVLSTAVQFTV